MTLCVPRTSDGCVLVRPAPGDAGVIYRFPVCRIIFFARGNVDTAEAACFAFTAVVASPAPPEGEEEQPPKYQEPANLQEELLV